MSTYNPIVHPGFAGFDAWGGGEEGDGTDMIGAALPRHPWSAPHAFIEEVHPSIQTPDMLLSTEDEFPVPAHASRPPSGRRRMVRDLPITRLDQAKAA